MSLDGVMQAPGGAEEDMDGGFAYGGWTAPYWHDEIGAIVNMASTAGLTSVRGMSAYVAGKHGVIGLTKSAALDYASQGIHVNAIAPGPIMNEHIASLSDEMRKPITQAVPMGRAGWPEEVATTAAWLCSDYPSFHDGRHHLS